MKSLIFRPHILVCQITRTVLCFVLVGVLATPLQAQPPEPFVAVHVSEFTQALETMPATQQSSPYTGYQWRYPSWHYFVAYESLKETLRSDGTPFVVVSDSDVAAGKLLNPDGSPRFPILISLAAEAIDDNEIAPLRSFVNAGGFLFVGSSSFTRKPDGTDRGDFALAYEMGVHMASSTPNPANDWNWYNNMHFTKTASHRLTSHIPDGTLVWRGPMTLDDIPWGVTPNHTLHGAHYAEDVVAGGATVLAQGDSGPFLTVRNYGQGQFIFHGPIQPFLGLGVIDPSMYTYLVYRRAIEWAFESFGVPIIKLSPWRYPYDAALIVRHDFEIDIPLIKAVYSSAQYEQALGVKGDYYFCTGTLRTYTGTDKSSIISSLKNAVSLYGATIGPHNGGLRNPMNLSLVPSDEDYWHWGPDEILDMTPPPPGYASGKAYATTSIANSFKDIEGWLAGTDNGRPGCGAARNCPRIWASPYMNSTREDSNDILLQMSAITMGEQKVGPFPHWTLSYKVTGMHYPQLSLPESDWYVGSEIPQALDMGHTVNSIGPAVDFYYNLGGMINFYGHQPSNNGGLEQQYVTYSMSKPRLWSTNAVGIYDWWLLRSKVSIAPDFTTSGSTSILTASVSGATDGDTAVEIVLPEANGQTISSLSVFLNGTPANTSDYRTTNYGLKVRVGASVSSVQVQYAVQGTNSLPVAVNDSYSTTVNTALNLAAPGVLANDTDPGGVTLTAQLVTGPSHGTITLNSNGSFTYTPTTNFAGSDSFTYMASDGANSSNVATVNISVSSAVTLSSLAVNPTSVTGGTASVGTVTLSGAAPSGGVVVTLSDNSSSASVPASVTVASGSTSATFSITTYSVTSSQSVTISATYGGVTKTATLTVNPASLTLSTLSLNPTSVRGGSTSVGTVTLSSAAPSGGVVVTLSDNSPYASVPASVTVASGSTSATFTITTSRVYNPRTVTISASYGGVSKSATLKITR
jgi:hypothetical protein